MPSFKIESGDWIGYRKLPNIKEVDFHRAETESTGSYYENMQDIWNAALWELEKAQEGNYRYVLFTHGWSTSKPGKTTARSQIRKLMRSKESTPFIIRKDCIQHPSVFVAAIRPK